MNLLNDALIRVHLGSPGMEPRTESVTLPHLMELLGREEVAGYPGLQKHQEDAFHVFLSLLGSAALARKRVTSPAQAAGFWRTALLELAGDAGSHAWDLVSEDPSRAAFMQPPLPAPDWEKAAARDPIVTPDQLDLLPTGRNHDVKRMRAASAHPDTWIFALVSLQTMSGFFGQGNYGICRMNSGFGNRVIAEVVHSFRPDARWCHALLRLPGHRAETLDGPWGYRPDGVVLLWTLPWDGETQVRLQDLDPFFIEVCRRVRLVRDRDRLVAHVAPTKRQRVSCEDLRGVVGDPWTPVDVAHKDGPTAFTAPSTGLGVSSLHRIVFSDNLRETSLHRPVPSLGGPVAFSVSVLVRGQGKTEGFHHQVVPVPVEARRRLFGTSGESWRQRAAALGRQAIGDADTMRRRVLKPAVFALLQGGPDNLDLTDDTADAWWSRIDRRFQLAWRAEYFPWLWSLDDNCEPEKDLPRWHRVLVRAARTSFTFAEATLPRHTGRRYRSIATAKSRLEGAIFRLFPAIKEVPDDTAEITRG